MWIYITFSGIIFFLILRRIVFASGFYPIYSRTLWSGSPSWKTMSSLVALQIPSFYGTRIFIVTFVKSYNILLSSAKMAHSLPCTLICMLGFSISFPSILSSSNYSLSCQDFPPKFYLHFSVFPCSSYPFCLASFV